MPWLLDMLKNDVFCGKEKITKGQFMEVRGDSPDKNAFWRVVSQIAVEKFNMKEVFDMRSTVRLAAIEKLCKPVLLVQDCHSVFWGVLGLGDGYGDGVRVRVV